MASVNKCIFIGHIGQAPEFKDHGSFVSCQFSIATTETWKDRQTRERRERTEWVRCEATGKLAEICRDLLDKGVMVYIEGSLSTDRVARKDGDGFNYFTRIKVSEMQKLSKREGGPAAGDDTGGAGDGGYDGEPSDYDDSTDGDGGASGDSGSAPAAAAPAPAPAPAPRAPAAAGGDKPWTRRGR